MKRKNCSLKVLIMQQIVMIMVVFFYGAASASGREDLEASYKLRQQLRQLAEDIKTAHELEQEVLHLQNEGRFQDAIPLAEHNLKIVENCQGRFEDLILDASLNRLPLPVNLPQIRQMGKLTVASSLSTLARLHMYIADYNLAAPLLQRSLSIFEKELGPEHLEVGGCLNDLASLYMGMGNLGQAKMLYHRSLAIREKNLGLKHPDVAASLNNLATLYLQMGDYGRSEPLYQRSLETLEKASSEHPSYAALSLTGLAALYRAVGDYGRAEPLYQRIVAIKEKVWGPEHIEVAGSIANLAGFYRAMGDYGRAEPLYQRSLALFEKALGPEHPNVKYTKRNIGYLYIAQGKLNEAYEIFKEHEKFAWSHGIGHYNLVKGNHQEAARHFQKIAEDIRNRSDTNLEDVTIGLGLAREGLKQYAEAAKAFEQAVSQIEEQRAELNPAGKTHFLSGEAGTGFKRIEAYEGLVRVKAAMQDQAGAFFSSEYTKARALLDALPRGKTAGFLPPLLSQQEQELTTKLRGLYKQRDATFGKNPELFKKIDEHDLPQARQELARFVETLRKEQPLYAAVNYPQPLPVSQIKLNAGEALIAYEVTEETTLGWLVRDGKIITSVNIPISRKDLTKKITGYRNCFENVTDYKQLSQFDPHQGKALYDLLFKPFADHLTPIAPLIIVPDEILGILPFETLVAEHPEQITWKAGQYGPVPQEVTYLGDMFPINYSQSATTLTLSRTLQPAVASLSNRMLVVADPVFDLTDARLEGFSDLLAQKTDKYQMHLRNAVAEGFKSPDAKPKFGRLNATRQLGEKLRGIYGGSIEVLQGLDADEPSLRSRPLDQYSYQVFATHGILDNQIPYIQEPALMLSQVGVNPQVPEEDGFLTMSEVMGLRLQAQLVALTACSTGVGKRLTGEGVMGMGRAFQYAGVQSVLMSLWSVEDESTNLLTERLFVHLNQGKDHIEALRMARADIRQAGYDHPFFWAPFIMVSAGSRDAKAGDRFFGLSEFDKSSAMVPDDSGGYYVGGSSDFQGATHGWINHCPENQSCTPILNLKDQPPNFANIMLFDLLRLPNGDMIAAGSGLPESQTGLPVSEQKEDGWAIRFTSNGQIAWSRKYPSNAHERFYFVKALANGTILVGGRTEMEKELGQSSGVSYVIDPENGNLITRKEWGTDIPRCGFYDGFGLPNGGYVLVGWATNPETNTDDVWVVSAGANHDEQWNKLSGAEGDDLGYRAAMDENGNIMVFGWGTQKNAQYTSGLVLRFKPSGEVDRSAFLDVESVGDDKFFTGLVLPGGGYLAAGEASESTKKYRAKAWSVMLDHNLEQVGEKRFGITGSRIVDIKVDSDNRVTVAGYGVAPAKKDVDAWMADFFLDNVADMAIP